MGSRSDEAVVEKAVQVLREFRIPCEVHVMSAHRTPKKVQQYSTIAAKRGLEVIIAAAGKAAHLPGVIASMTILPVIGIPIKTSDLGGLDSLFSIVQMPKGVPVATVAINGAQNAALLAVEILAIKHTDIRKKLVKYKESLAKAK
ncbi:MAG: 5-(carboxyamino)imidazole ribonucleotide mutase [bacterium]